MKKNAYFIVLLLVAGYGSSAHADWNWPWEDSGDYQDSSDGFGDFLGGFFGGERTHLDFEYELDMQMRYDMDYAGEGYNTNYGYSTGEGYNGRAPYDSQAPAYAPGAEYVEPREMVQPDAYRDAIEAQRRMVEQMAAHQQQTVQRFEESRDKVASKMVESSPQSRLQEMQQRRAEAFREMQQKHNSFDSEPTPSGEPRTTGMMPGY